ncbi:hypothetical protein MRBLMI12_003583 [Microbacterium sp. LMI12-1-1.1]|uniref:hypothetical protein n=1 Tax=Microbacterium sp. LMI12-1-1.1 TaxID=3135225 RepID=UPI00342E50D2
MENTEFERIVALRVAVVSELCVTAETIAARPAVMADVSQPLLVRYACLQAFLIDVRALAVFLLGPGKGRVFEGDLHATDFVADWVASEPEADRLRDIVDDVNKQLAHFTVTRMGDGRYQLPVEMDFSDEQVRAIADDVGRLWDDFAARSDDLYQIGELPPWHVPGTDRLRTEADGWPITWLGPAS